MRILSNERLLDLVAVLMVGAAAASSASVGAWVKPSEFRAKSDRVARLHQLQAQQIANSTAGRSAAMASTAARNTPPVVVADAR